MGFTYLDEEQQDTLRPAMPEVPLAPEVSPRPQAKPQGEPSPFSYIEEETPASPFVYLDEETIAPEESEPTPYSEKDLTKDEFFIPIQSYMHDRFGVDSLRGYTKQETVDKFLNNMRGFSGGNTVRAFNEISYLNSKDDGEMNIPGEAYAIFEGMETVFGDTSWREKGGAIWDYGRQAVLDPANIISFGVGKLAVGGATKAATKVAQKAALSAFRKEIAKGATKAAAKEVGQKVFNQSMKEVAKSQVKGVAARQAARKATSGSLAKKVTTSAALKEIAASTGVDAAFAVGTDIAYQNGLIRTENQEEYSTLQTGIAALGGLVMGGIQAGSVAASAPSRLNMPSVDTPAPSPKQVIPNLKTQLVEHVDDWKNMVQKGQKLEEVHDDVFITMLLGNDDKGIKGLTEILVEEGYEWNKELDGTIGEFIGNVLKTTDPEDAGAMMQTLRNELGIDVPASYDINDFADLFAYRVNRQATGMNALSQAARKLNKPVEEITLGDAIHAKYGDDPESGLVSRLAESDLGKAWSETTAYRAQNNVIRLIVSNLSTTMLNLTGWAQAAGLNTTTDVAKGLLHSGGQSLKLLAGDTTGPKAAWTTLGRTWRNVQNRAQNLIDPNTTYDAFMSYAQMRPKAMAELTRVLPGGVEDINKVLKESGFRPQGKGGEIGEDLVDAIQMIGGVKAQDMFTKSQEFVYQLDKKLMENFDKGWSDFFASPDARKIMNTEQYVRIEQEATYETLRAIYSKSYKGKNLTGEIAGVIEDARNLPGVGLMVPFGRFFNNTVATMVDATPYPAIAKTIKYVQGKDIGERSLADLYTRSAVSISLVGLLAAKEDEYIEAGLAWDERIMANGGVETQEWEFPMSFYKAAARLKAHNDRGDEIPQELVEQLGKNFFGQVTRQLDESGSAFGEFAVAALQFELDRAAQAGMEMVKGSGQQIISGSTRFIDPLNQAIGLTRGQDFSAIDRRQGNEFLNNSLRYMDQILAVVSGEDLAPEQNSAASGNYEVQVDKFLGPQRENIGPTSTEKMFNFIGKEPFKAGSYSDSPEADNEYNRIFHQAIEHQAEKLIQLKEFRNGDLERRQFLVKQVTERARDFTLEMMKTDVNNTGTAEQSMMIELSNVPRRGLQRAMEDLGYEVDLNELDYQQLQLLKTYIDNREEYLKVTDQ